MTNDTTPRADLLPCPFCGNEARFGACEVVDGDDNAGAEYVECSGCSACTALVFPTMESTKPLLTERWNRRAACEGAGSIPSEVELRALADAIVGNLYDRGLIDLNLEKELVEEIMNEMVGTVRAALAVPSGFDIARDAILHGRGALEGVLDSDQTNAVLAELDAAFPPPLAVPSEGTAAPETSAGAGCSDENQIDAATSKQPSYIPSGAALRELVSADNALQLWCLAERMKPRPLFDNLEGVSSAGLSTRSHPQRDAIIARLQAAWEGARAALAVSKVSNQFIEKLNELSPSEGIASVAASEKPSPDYQRGWNDGVDLMTRASIHAAHVAAQPGQKKEKT